jgi:hypothetical protein
MELDGCDASLLSEGINRDCKSKKLHQATCRGDEGSSSKSWTLGYSEHGSYMMAIVFVLCVRVHSVKKCVVNVERCKYQSCGVKPRLMTRLSIPIQLLSLFAPLCP